jgi:hypothetical protein
VAFSGVEKLPARRHRRSRRQIALHRAQSGDYITLGYGPLRWRIPMTLRLRFGSMRGLLTFVGFLLVFGILVELAKDAPGLRVVWAVFWFVFLLIGSAGIFIHMWRRRGSRDQFWKYAHGGQIAFLPPKWRRWVLGEDDPR